MRVHNVCQVVEDHALGDGLDHVGWFSVIEVRLNDMGGELASRVRCHGRQCVCLQTGLLALLRRTHVGDAVLERTRNEDVADVAGGIGQNQITGTKLLVDLRLLPCSRSATNSLSSAARCGRTVFSVRTSPCSSVRKAPGVS
jgi:hypothetical protein